MHHWIWLCGKQWKFSSVGCDCHKFDTSRREVILRSHQNPQEVDACPGDLQRPISMCTFELGASNNIHEEDLEDLTADCQRARGIQGVKMTVWSLMNLKLAGRQSGLHCNVPPPRKHSGISIGHICQGEMVGAARPKVAVPGRRATFQNLEPPVSSPTTGVIAHFPVGPSGKADDDDDADDKTVAA